MTKPTGLRALRPYSATALLAVCFVSAATLSDPIGGETIVASEVTDIAQPTLAVDGAGGSLAVWVDGGNVFSRRYAADGGAQSVLQVTNSGTASNPRAAFATEDHAFVVYEDFDAGTGERGIFAIPFVVSAYYSPFKVNDYVYGTEHDSPAIAADASEAVVVWRTSDDGSGSGIHARKIGLSGTVGAQVRVNQDVQGNQRAPSVATTPDGNLTVVAFSSFNSQPYTCGWQTKVVRLDAQLAVLGGENTEIPCQYGWPNFYPSVTIAPDGQFAVAYQAGNEEFGRVFMEWFDPQGARWSRNNVTATLDFQRPIAQMSKLGMLTLVASARREDGSGLQDLFAWRFGPNAGQIGSRQTLTSSGVAVPSLEHAAGADDDGQLWGAWVTDLGQLKARRFAGSQTHDLSIAIEASTPVADDGDIVSFQVDVSNASSGPYATASATGLMVDVALSDQLAISTVSGDGWSCLAGYFAASCTLASLEGAAEPIIIRASVIAGDQATVTVNVAGEQQDPIVGNNQALESVAITADGTPDPFYFASRGGVPLSTTVVSDAVTITGIDQAVISVTNGEYSVDGGAFTSARSVILVGQAVAVRHVSAATHDTNTTTTLTIGGVTATFSSTTVPDTTPYPFSFTDQSDVATDTEITSAAVTIWGINCAPVTVNGGLYSLNNSYFTNVPGTICNGNSVRVRHVSSASYRTTVSTTLDIGGVSDTFQSTTQGDTIPDPFSFPTKSNVARSTVIESDAVTISGLGEPAQISVSGGSYSINDGTLVTAPGTITNGKILRLYITSSNSFSTNKVMSVTIGGVTAFFTVRTVDQDTTPTPFGFEEQRGVARNTVITSNTIQISGTNWPALVTVSSGGSYSINNGPFTTSSSGANSGDVIRVRHTSSASYSGRTTTTLTVGGVAGTFTTTTLDDLTPDAFSFTDQTAVSPGSVVTSNALTITGISAPTAISVSGGTYSIDGGAFTSTSGTIAAGQSVSVRHTASTQSSTTTSTELTIGGIGDVFTSRTADDVTPDQFTFVDVENAGLSGAHLSNVIQVSGITAPVTATVSGGTFKIGGGACTNWPATVSAGSTVQVCLSAANTYNTKREAVVTIGGVSDSFSVTTKAPPDTTPDPFSFAPVANANLGADYYSNPITVSGIDALTPISIASSTSTYAYSVNGGQYRAVSGSVANGDVITVRGQASTIFDHQTSGRLTIGGVFADFVVRTVQRDALPDEFAFDSVDGLMPYTWAYSNTVTITGINDRVNYSGRPEVSIDGGPFQADTSPQTLVAGQTVQLRVRSSTFWDTAMDHLVTIGDRQVYWTVTTVPEDREPDSFYFAEQSAPPLTKIRSAPAIVTGINTEVCAVIVVKQTVPTGAYPRISVNGGEWSDVQCGIKSGDSIALEMTSSAVPTERQTATVSIGTRAGSWTVTTSVGVPPLVR